MDDDRADNDAAADTDNVVVLVVEHTPDVVGADTNYDDADTGSVAAAAGSNRAALDATFFAVSCSFG